MRWSWKIGEIAGIGIYVHWTFLLLVAYFAYAYAVAAGEASAAIEGVLFLIAVFACIVAHELGHALTARKFGIKTRDITLLPIGGLARLERMPEAPMQEFLVAIAGPAVTAVLAVLFGGISVALGGWESLRILDPSGGSFIARLAWINGLLLGFNLLPAFPMDGGRVLRALLHTSMNYARATQIAATVGQAMAIGFGILGLFFNFWLLIIAFFVFIAAHAEAESVQVRYMTNGVPVRDAMVTNFRTLAPDATLNDAVQTLLTGEQQDFPIVRDGSVVGVLTRSELLKALASNGSTERHVQDVMNASCKPAEDDEMLDKALARMRENSCAVLPVTRRGELVGMITLENVGEWIMIQDAMRRGHPRDTVDNVFRAQ